MSYSSANRNVESALSVSYCRKIVYGTWQGKSLVGGVVLNTYSAMHEYHRIARKQYKYVGLTYEDALSCAADMRTLYTRTVSAQTWNEIASHGGMQGNWETLGVTSEEMSAEIVPRHVGGSLWEVTVSVNEDSVFMSRTDIPRQYSVIFAAERNRGYDGETET